MTSNSPPTTPPVAAVDLAHELSAGFAHRFIRFKVKQIIGRAGIKNADREDIEQDLCVLLVRRFSQFDPTKSDWPAFVTTIVERRIATIFEYWKRVKRSAEGSEVSLSELSHGPDGQLQELSDQLSTDDAARRMLVSCRADAERFEIDQDLATTLKSLPEEARAMCDALKEVSIRELARRQGISHTTLWYRLKRMRPHFAARDIFKFLTKRFDHPSRNAVAP